jgi:hypothetical protein
MLSVGLLARSELSIQDTFPRVATATAYRQVIRSLSA